MAKRRQIMKRWRRVTRHRRSAMLGPLASVARRPKAPVHQAPAPLDEPGPLPGGRSMADGVPDAQQRLV